MISDTQLAVTATLDEYRRASTVLWGPAGAYAAAEFERINNDLFGNSLAPIGIVIGLTAYGACIGLTRHTTEWLAVPRITLAPKLFNKGGAKTVTDVLIHEMVHAALILRGDNPEHNADPWCRLIADLSPKVLGHEITARPVRTCRVPNPARESDPKAPKTIVVRRADPGALPRMELAGWPRSLRPQGFYDDDRPISVPTY